jgi:hypothetical protein
MSFRHCSQLSAPAGFKRADRRIPRRPGLILAQLDQGFDSPLEQAQVAASRSHRKRMRPERCANAEGEVQKPSPNGQKTLLSSSHIHDTSGK